MTILPLNGKWGLKSLSIKPTIQEMNVTIPGSVISGLLENSIIPDPYDQSNESTVQSFFQDDYMFFRTFEVTNQVLKQDEITLHCEGLDTLAEIYVNGQWISSASNMFRSYQFNISNVLKSGVNTIEIKFESPVKYVEKVKRMGAVKGVEFIRKAQCMFGWDWGIKLPDSGIWKDIYIEFGKAAKLGDVLFRQEHQVDRVILGFEMEEITGDTKGLQLETTVYDPEGERLFSERQSLSGKSSGEFIIENPQLWWPNGYGDQPLYEIEFQLIGRNQILDKRKSSVGLRTVVLNREDEGDGSKYEFVVNNVPVFAKGTNMVIQDAIISRSGSKELEEMVENCLLANMNFIRVWGGAYYPPNTFFDLCDKNGILVYLDCMFTSTFYPVSEEFLENVTIEIEQNIKRIRNHACLALICGNNELDMVYTMLTSDELETAEVREFFGSAKLEDEMIKQYICTNYSKLFLQLIPEIFEKLAPQLSYVHSSPSTKNPGKARSIFDYIRDGDFHYYLAYNGRAPYEKILQLKPRFVSEMGFQSYPSIKTINQFTKLEDRSPYSSVMLTHQKCKDGNEIIEYYMGQDYLIPVDFEKYVYVSQVLAGEILKFSVEHFRRNRGYSMGILLWQMNDCWPTVSWAGVDYYGRWKAQQYYTKRFYSPILLSARLEGKKAELWVTNDLLKDVTGMISWKLRDSNSHILLKGEQKVVAKASSANLVIFLDFDQHLTDVNLSETYLEYSFNDGEQSVSTGTTLFVKPKEFHFKNPTIQVDVQDAGDNFLIKVRALAFAKAVSLDLVNEDCIFSDNYFDLSGDEEKVITVNRATISGQLNIQTFKQQLVTTSLYDVSMVTN